MDQTTANNNLQSPAKNGFSLTPSSLDEAIRFSEIICNSDICPSNFKGNAGNVLVAVQMGAEIGLAPIQSIQNIAVINGRACVWGDALPALAKNHPQFEYMDESFDDDKFEATCKIKRRGEPVQTVTFSRTDAQKAKLWTKKGPWTDYQERI